MPMKDETVVIATIGLVRAWLLAYFLRTGKTVFTREDLDTKTPQELLKEIGIDA